MKSNDEDDYLRFEHAKEMLQTDLDDFFLDCNCSNKKLRGEETHYTSWRSDLIEYLADRNQQEYNPLNIKKDKNLKKFDFSKLTEADTEFVLGFLGKCGINEYLEDAEEN